MRPASRGKQAPPTIDPGPRPRQLPRGKPCGMHAHDDVVLGGVRVRQVREGQPARPASRSRTTMARMASSVGINRNRPAVIARLVHLQWRENAEMMVPLRS